MSPPASSTCDPRPRWCISQSGHRRALPPSRPRSKDRDQDRDQSVYFFLLSPEIDAPEDTLIIYASDNGSYRKDRVGGLRGQKGVNWEGGIRVPGIFHWPGTIAAGAVSSEPAGLADVLPTVCGLLSLEKPTDVHLDGSDLSPILTSKAGEFTRHQPLFWHLQKSRPIVAMRDGDYSLVADPDYELSTSNMFQEAWIPAIKQGGRRGAHP